MENTISLCMIVKNEEKLLSTCLDSVKDFVHEIIIIDTGSIDKTKEIALSYGAKVLDFVWVNDFAAARNFAKAHATQKWILQLDADEYLESNEAIKLSHIVNSTNHEAVNVFISNIKKNKQPSSTHTNVRLFKNLNDISYNYALHEQPFYNGAPIKNVFQSDIHVMHLGYIDEIVLAKNKRQRNLDILQNELKVKPKDRFIMLNIGSEYLASKDYDKAMYYYQKATKKEKDIQMLEKAILKMCVCYEQSGRDEEALRLLAKGKNLFTDYTDLYFLEGEILQKQGREKDATINYLHCLEPTSNTNTYVSYSEIGSTMPLLKLANLSRKNRQLQSSVDYYSQVLNIDKYNEEAAISMFRILKDSGETTEALSLMHTLYVNNSPKDVVFKYRLLNDLLLREDLIIISDLIADQFNQTNSSFMSTSSFYVHLLKGELVNAQDFLENSPVHSDTLKFLNYLYIHFHPNYSLVETIEKDLSDEKLSIETFLNLLEELLKLEEFKAFEDILSFSTRFPDEILKGIAQIFYLANQDDLAIEFFIKYLDLGYEETSVYLKTAELLSSTDFYLDTITFAEKAFNLDSTNFKPIELILDTYHKMGENDLAKSFAADMLPHYPKSQYLADFSRI